MSLGEWIKIYLWIARRMGYSVLKDQLAALILLLIALGKLVGKRELERIIRNRAVVVFGAGPSLEYDVIRFKRLYDKGFKPIIVSADGATKALIEIGLKPDIIVTDLDGYLPAIVYSNLKNSYVVVHAHGDNIDKLISYVRFFRKIIGTTQVMPLPKIYNFGGFTDGDRCIYLAYSLKARYVLLFGMDFGSKVGRYSKEFISDYKTKIVKLAIGKLLISLLSNRIKIYNATYSKPVIKGVENIEL